MAKPVISFKLGSINFAVFENETKKGINKAISINRTYKTDKGFETTNSFRVGDLALVSVGVNKLIEMIYSSSLSAKNNSSSINYEVESANEI